MKTIWMLALLCWAATSPAAKTNPDEEAKLIKVLQSSASPTEKEDACRRLKQVGTAKCVPVVAELLTDERLYQSACDVLETLPVKPAGAALRAALKTTTRNAKAGVIHALGERRHHQATSDLADLLHDSDPRIATAAARALGEIGGSTATRALRKALKIETLRSAATDALMSCASRYVADGDVSAARKIYEQFDSPAETAHVRTAAYAGLIRISGKKSLDLIVAGIQSNDGARQAAALQLARASQDAQATAAFVNLLSRVPPAAQCALINLLEQRGDIAAAPALVRFAASNDAEVRVTAIAALGNLGDATMIPLLAQAATSRNDEEKKAAQESLLRLRRGKVTETLLEQLRSSPPDVQAEIARALSGRWEKSAVPTLLELANSPSEPTRRAAFRALNQLADETHFEALVKLMETSANESQRGNARDVFESVAERMAPGTKPDVAPLVASFAKADADLRIAFLQVAALFADERLRTLFRSARHDPDAKIRAAAERTACTSRDPELMPELIDLARNAPDSNLKALALEGYVRLAAGEEATFPAKKKVELLTPAFNLAANTEEKKLVLSALGKIGDPEALKLVESADDETVRAEAEIAGYQIAKALLPVSPTPAQKTLERLSATAQSGTLRTNATTTLQEFRKQSKK